MIIVTKLTDIICQINPILYLNLMVAVVVIKTVHNVFLTIRVRVDSGSMTCRNPLRSSLSTVSLTCTQDTSYIYTVDNT